MHAWVTLLFSSDQAGQRTNILTACILPCRCWWGVHNSLPKNQVHFGIEVCTIKSGSASVTLQCLSCLCHFHPLYGLIKLIMVYGGACFTIYVTLLWVQEYFDQNRWLIATLRAVYVCANDWLTGKTPAALRQATIDYSVCNNGTYKQTADWMKQFHWRLQTNADDNRKYQRSIVATAALSWL